jgi:RNA polymerase sigma factor (sigma-70 family)
MLTSQQKAVLAHLRREAAGAREGELSDRELLERFLGHRDAAALTVLVRRHAATVLGVCRRVLRNSADAEDAFQATFLVLIRQAGSIARPEALGSWLYGVAYRVALKARGDTRRRRQLESAAPAPEAPAEPCSEVRHILDEEVSRLPAKYRRPVVLCYFEGKTYQEAARLLGWPAGTASTRLARARALLRTRLARRGVTLSAAALAACLTEGVAPAGELRLAEMTAGLALRWISHPASAGVGARVIALTEGVVKAMLLTKVKAVFGMLVVFALALGGAGALWRSVTTAPAAEPASETPASPVRALAAPAKEGDRPPQSRIGLINMTRALKEGRSFQATKAALDLQTKKTRQMLDFLSGEAKKYQAERDDPATPAARRDEAARHLRQLQREIEDEQETARGQLAKQSGEAIVAMYREVEQAANRVARARGLELVLFYTDAVTEADFYSPASLERKLAQPGALVPMIAAPGMDITEAVIEAVNRK